MSSISVRRMTPDQWQTWREVVEDNQAARKLYERLGFQAAGQDQPHPNGPAVRELRMVYGITDLSKVVHGACSRLT